MSSNRLTVAQVADLLNRDAVQDSVLAALHDDSRISVVRLLQKWQQRQTAIRQERERVQQLYRYERLLNAKGFQLIAGVDEAGRGPLAGPVVIGAAILPAGCHLTNLNDSKKLSAKQRFELYTEIKRVAVAAACMVMDVAEIDKLNIYQATVKGMYAAIAALNPAPEAVLIDAVPLPGLPFHSQSLIGGDAISASIAAASIIAKVERDRIMEEFDYRFPGYGFARHKGYGTAEHLKAIRQHGPCPIHRRSFEPIKSWGDYCES
ncbi:ribonuclease HII|uniref:Ribonuclease HII n=1 Tax=Dendrosporobacter quercicolus TaxID=146817 RepID=A0A1G9LAS7_9FIRM|nr:ribonuclease HII [Dendrosporobacter quercicolus]NSL46655.1 ribonuclease HII [Dendrosporobacter quercicolus DSM 1736]SDL59070.1 RNase HII [Dendrosporobacter quercicolus]